MCLCKPEIRTPWCDDCQSFAYQRIKELESTVLDLQSELARKKMSLTVACNRVEELEEALASSSSRIRVDLLPTEKLRKLAFRVDEELDSRGVFR